uniref:PH domain-containing protein n=1 Tax=Caenorhabditis japonica TaxID=281687 RepID=A0A8R1HG98_CAEJA
MLSRNLKSVRGIHKSSSVLKSNQTVTKLENGLTVATIEDNKPVSQLVLAFKAGSRFENSNQAGLTHTIRNFVGRDTQQYFGSSIVWTSAAIGAVLKSFTTRDVFGVALTLPRDQISAGLSILGQAAAVPGFKPWEVEDVYPTMRADNAFRTQFDFVIDGIHKAAYRNSGLANTIFSPCSKIGSISSDALTQFANKHFVSGNAVIFATNAKHEDVELYGKNYSPIRNGSAVTAPKNTYKILRETEIVGADSLNGRRLFNSIDTFFSYGLLTADGTYWRCIRCFLPRVEQKMLVAECGNANDRFLSIGWLKTSFNKGTLHFMLLALNNPSNKAYLARFYHINACIRNSGLLEAITQYIEQLQPVQFAFYSTRQLRPEPAPAAVIDTASVQISSRAAARQRKLTEKEASSDTVPNILPKEIPSMLIDQDVLLDEIVRNRHNRLSTEMYEAQATNEDYVLAEPQTNSNNVEKLEDVMSKKMSCANMESMDTDGLEKILASVELEQEGQSTNNDLADGEYQMSQGDVLHFAIYVFEKSSEKIIESFKIIEGFYSDARKLRYFVMTNHNLYIFKYRVHSENPTQGKSTNISSNGFFIPLIRIPHDRVKSIKISIDNLAFMLEANELGFLHYVQNVEQDDQTCFSYSGSIASLESGAHMINSLINVVECSSRSLVTQTEIDDHIGYMCTLQPSIEKQLGRAVDVRAASLCFWYEQSCEDQKQGASEMSGYLFKTNVSNWMKSTNEAEQKFCLISGSSFLVFNDSSCTEECLSIDIPSSSLVTSGRVTFQLKGAQGNYAFECSSQEEFAKWKDSLASVIEKKDDQRFIAPCLAVVTESSIALVQEGEKFWTDGFIRLLNDLDAKQLKKVIIVPPKKKNSVSALRSPALCLVSEDGTLHYFFVRFEKELHRLAGVIQNTFDVVCETLDDDQVLELPDLEKNIQNTCCSVKDLWPN